LPPAAWWAVAVSSLAHHHRGADTRVCGVETHLDALTVSIRANDFSSTGHQWAKMAFGKVLREFREK